MLKTKEKNAKNNTMELEEKIFNCLNDNFSRLPGGAVTLKNEAYTFHFVCGGVNGVLRDSLGINNSILVYKTFRKWCKQKIKKG